MKLYLIPGMGVDCRLFGHLQAELDGVEIETIEWIRPLPEETIASYAQRMASKIKDDRFFLGGVSFGGVIANEIAKFKKPEQLILISTIKNSQELPPHLRLLRTLPLHKTLPDFVYAQGASVAKLIRPVFGLMDDDDKELFNEMVACVDPVYLKWAINAIINWESKVNPEKFVHIHGTHDAIFPVRFIKNPFIPVSGGSHLMICSRAKELKPLLEKVLLIEKMPSG